MPGSKLKFRNGTTVPLEVAPLFGDGRGALGLPEVENASLVIETPCGWMESGDIIRMVDLTQDEMPRGTVTYVAPFYGIRFAAPLTQTLRWKPPVPQPCWPNGTVLPTKNFGPGCLDSHGHGEEDCLFLNVYTPLKAPATTSTTVAPTASTLASKVEELRAERRRQGLLPVVVYLHGGGLLWGNGREALWRVAGDWQRPVVTVTVQYRLQLFGFYASAELSAEQGGTSGNYGLMDQQEALRWVQKNIKAFGGDPARVTVVGVSSGGTSLLALLAAPSTKGLLHAGVSLSGSPNITIDMKAAEAQNAPIIQATPCAGLVGGPARLACMRNLTWPQIVAAIPVSWSTPGLWELPRGPPGQQYAGLPVVDGKLVTQPVLEALRSNVVDVPLLLSAMQYEADCLPDVDLLALSPEQWKQYLLNKMAPWGRDVAKQIYDLYEPEARASAQKAFGAILSDVALICGTIALAKAAAGAPPTAGNATTTNKPPASISMKRRSALYVFVNSWHPSLPIVRGPSCTTKYAFHGWDARTWQRDYDQFSPDASDLAHSRFLRETIYQVAATGKLEDALLDVSTNATTSWRGLNDSPRWPSAYRVNVMLSDKEGGPRVVEDFKAERCRWFESKGMGQNVWWCD